MACDVPNVDFDEGKLTIRRQKDKHHRQGRVLKCTAGEKTVRLVESVLAESARVTLASI